MNAAPSKPLPHERIRLIGTPVGRMVRIDDFDDEIDPPAPGSTPPSRCSCSKALARA